MLTPDIFAQLTLEAFPWFSVNLRSYYTYSQAVASRELAKRLGGSQAAQLASVWINAIRAPNTSRDVMIAASAEALVSAAGALSLSPEGKSVLQQAYKALYDVIEERPSQNAQILADVNRAFLRLPFQEFIKTIQDVWKDLNGDLPYDPAVDTRGLKEYMVGRFYVFKTDYAIQEWDSMAKVNIDELSRYRVPH